MKELILQFYEKYADFAFRVAFIRTNNRADAEDLSHEVMLKIIKNHDILKELLGKNEVQARGYLAKAVINMTIEKYKKSSNRIKREQSYASAKTREVDEADNHSFIDEHKLTILNAIKELPEKYQTVLMLKFYEGHSNSDLSDMLQLKEVSIRSLISRAIQKLKSRLAIIGVALTANTICSELEATELISASPDFKARLANSIQENYTQPVFASQSKVSYFTITSIASILLITIYFSNHLFSTNPSKDTATSTGTMSLTPVKNTNLYQLHFDAKEFESQPDMATYINDATNHKNDNNESFSIEKKGLSTIGSKTASLEFPYILKAEKPLIFECEVDVVQIKNKKYASSIGLSLKIHSPKDKIQMPLSNENTYRCKFVIINKNMFYESSLHKGLHSFKVVKNGFDQHLGLNFNHCILKSFSLREMSDEEVNSFKKENQAAYNEIDAFQP